MDHHKPTHHSDIDHRASNKVHQKPGSAADPVKSFRNALAAASDKGAAVKKALVEAHHAPRLTSQIVTAALEETSGADRGMVMAAMIKFNPQLAHTIAHMNPNLTSLHGAHLEALGQNVAMLPLNRINVQGAFFANNVNLSHNNLQGANFDGVTAPGLMTAGAHGQFSAHGAHFEQEVATRNTASQAKLGAITGFGFTDNTTRSGHLKPADAPVPEPKVTAEGQVAKASTWKLDSPFATEPKAPLA